MSVVFDELQKEIRGEARTDTLARALYATDASIYEIMPDAVVWPACVEDVIATVRFCARHGLPLTARGAGTGLSGGCVNRGVILDTSRSLNQILDINPEARTARVRPGVVLDELNAELRPHGLHFSPDVATASRATIGGMIGNNSAGAHSIVVGRTSDHVLNVDVVLSDASIARWGGDGNGADTSTGPLAQHCEDVLTAVARDYAEEIQVRFPKVFRRNGGYALDRLRCENGRLNVEQVLVGGEGTLGVVVGATLKLLPLPKEQGLVVVHYDDLLKALASVPTILEHQPAAIELVDKLILDGTRDNAALRPRRWFLDGDPQAVLIVELYDDDHGVLERRLGEVAADLKARSIGYAWPVVLDRQKQADVWDVRKAGTGLLMSQPGDTQPYDFVDDCAVDPARLRSYIQRLNEILAEESIPRTGYYAHASVGLLHVRPALNLKTREGVAKLRRIGERVADLVREFEGAMTGEHGDGLVRSEWIEQLFGPKLVEAFRKVKTAFDPRGIFNPGKIVAPLPMDQNLRYGAGFESHKPLTLLDFSAHGGMAGLAEMCSGIGECRKRLVGSMCPSYMATGDETHTTRARANALRLALSNRELLDGLDDPALAEVMDLCLSCKACKTECPTGTDVAKLKAEWLSHQNDRLGVPRRSRLIASSLDMAKWGSHFAPLSNWVMQSKVTRIIMEHLFGLDRRVPPPRFERQTFREWFRKRGGPVCVASSGSETPPQVVYFVDTWTNFYQPQVGRAAVKVLEAMGYEVIVPPTQCCGRPLISKGLLREAKKLAEANAGILSPYTERELPIVGTEPSCISALTDELPQFVRTKAAQRIADHAMIVEAFVARILRERPQTLHFKSNAQRLLYHGHCHQKALTGTAEAVELLRLCSTGRAEEINSGCCGMAGAFGHEVEHYDVARAVGEQRLFPAIRDRGDARIAVSGFSCRHHIEHHTAVETRHAIEVVADALEC